MKKINIHIPAGFWAALIWFLLGILIYNGIAGFSFTAYICFGLGALALCYQLLKLLAVKHPKAKMVLWWCLTVCLCLGLVLATVTGIFIGTAAAGSPDTDCDYVIVLGAGVNGTTPSYILRSRLNAAYDYLTANPDVTCIVSGGQGNGEDISEAQCMFEDLTEKGIDPERIWMEDKSTSTQENLAFSLALIEERTGQRPTTAGILSNDFHLFRAGLFAREQGLTPIGISAETGWLALEINYFLREIAGVWYYIIFGG